MHLMLCPASLRFHGPTIPLFDWNCIEDKYMIFFLLFLIAFFVNGHYPSFFVVFMDSCNLCHSNKLESLFECPVSHLLYDEGEVELWTST